MLKVDDWLAIRELGRQGVTVSEIGRQTGRDRKTVRKALTEAPPPERRRPVTRPSKLDPYREYLIHRTAAGCLNATVLFEEIQAQGYAGRLSILRDLLRPVRHEHRRAREAAERFETGPGQQAQVDWGEFGRIWNAGAGRWQKLHGFVFTLGYSRAQYLEFTTSCDQEHFLECHLGAFAALGIPERVLYDNLKTGILGRRPDGTPVLPGRFADFALHYGFTPTFCRPYRARTKGKVERGISYVRQNFWVRVGAAVAAQELDLAGLNERAREWVARVANLRVHGTHGQVVGERLQAEVGHLGRLDRHTRYDTAYHALRRVGRDGRFSYRGEVYQVGLSHAFDCLEVVEPLTGPLVVRSQTGQLIRAERLAPGTALRLARVTPPAPATAEPEPAVQLFATAPLVETRDLAVYQEVADAYRTP
jgi:transposase